ncbi:MAG TPA: hypothetical protein VF516_02270 [Kofleriaceae bacterium]
MAARFASNVIGDGRSAGPSGEPLVLEARGDVLGIHTAMDEFVEEATVFGLSEAEVDGERCLDVFDVVPEQPA